MATTDSSLEEKTISSVQSAGRDTAVRNTWAPADSRVRLSMLRVRDVQGTPVVTVSSVSSGVSSESESVWPVVSSSGRVSEPWMTVSEAAGSEGLKKPIT